MTTIKTKEYVLAELEIMRIFRSQIKRNILRNSLFLALLIFAGLALRHQSSPIVCGALGIGLPLGGMLASDRYHDMVRKYHEAATKAGLFSVPQRIECNDEFFEHYMKDGEFTKNPLAGLFSRVEKRGTLYRLVTKANEQIFVPLDAFESDADRQQFETLLASKGVKIIQK